jgi:hypothetical protein
MSAEAGRIGKARILLAAIGALLVPAALIAGTWNQQQSLPPQHRDAGTDRNLLGTPVADSDRKNEPGAERP